MTTKFQSVMNAAQQLPDAEQDALAIEIEDRIFARKIERGEADRRAGRVKPADQVFDELIRRYGG